MAEHEDLPVVARMVVEIRSDGSRTVARGALQDHQTGSEVAVRAEGTSPLSLAVSLARSLTRLPALAAAHDAGPTAHLPIEDGAAARRRRPSLRGALRRVARAARRIGAGESPRTAVDSPAIEHASGTAKGRTARTPAADDEG